MSPPSLPFPSASTASFGLPSFFTRSPSPLLPPTSNRRSTSTVSTQSPQERFDQALREDDERWTSQSQASTSRRSRQVVPPAPPPPPPHPQLSRSSSLTAQLLANHPPPVEMERAPERDPYARARSRSSAESAVGGRPFDPWTTRRAQSPSPEDFLPFALHTNNPNRDSDIDSDDTSSYQETVVDQPGSNTFLASTSERESSPYPPSLSLANHPIFAHNPPPPPPPPPHRQAGWRPPRLGEGGGGAGGPPSWIEPPPLQVGFGSGGRRGPRPFPFFPPASSSSSSNLRERYLHDPGYSRYSAPSPPPSRRCQSCNSTIVQIDSPTGGSYCSGCGIVIEESSQPQPQANSSSNRAVRNGPSPSTSSLFEYLVDNTVSELSSDEDEDEDPLSLRPVLPLHPSSVRRSEAAERERERNRRSRSPLPASHNPSRLPFVVPRIVNPNAPASARFLQRQPPHPERDLSWPRDIAVEVSDAEIRWQEGLMESQAQQAAQSQSHSRSRRRRIQREGEDNSWVVVDDDAGLSVGRGGPEEWHWDGSSHEAALAQRSLGSAGVGMRRTGFGSGGRGGRVGGEGGGERRASWEEEMEEEEAGWDPNWTRTQSRLRRREGRGARDATAPTKITTAEGGGGGGETVGLRCGGRVDNSGTHPAASSSSSSRPSTTTSTSYLYPNPLLQPTSPKPTSSSSSHGCGALIAFLPTSSSSLSSPIELVFTRTENVDPRTGGLMVKRRVLEVEKIWGVRGEKGGMTVGLGGEGGGKKAVMGCGCEREEVGCLGCGSTLGFYIPKPCLSHARDLYVPPPPPPQARPPFNTLPTPLHPPSSVHTYLPFAEPLSMDDDDDIHFDDDDFGFDFAPPPPSSSQRRRTTRTSSSTCLVNPSTAPLWAFRVGAVRVDERDGKGKGMEGKRKREEEEGGEEERRSGRVGGR